MLRLRLCRVFGCTLSELSSRITAEEFLVWQAYYSREPWGDEMRMLAKVLTVGLKATDFEKWLPYQCRSAYWDVTIGEEALDAQRREVASAFEALAQQIAGMTGQKRE